MSPRAGAALAALLGALDAQLELSAAAIGGRDSMSGTADRDVPPTAHARFAPRCSKGELRPT